MCKAILQGKNRLEQLLIFTMAVVIQLKTGFAFLSKFLVFQSLIPESKIKSFALGEKMEKINWDTEQRS